MMINRRHWNSCTSVCDTIINNTVADSVGALIGSDMICGRAVLRHECGSTSQATMAISRLESLVVVAMTVLLEAFVVSGAAGSVISVLNSLLK